MQKIYCFLSNERCKVVISLILLIFLLLNILGSTLIYADAAGGDDADTAYDISNAKLYAVPNQIYSGEEITPDIILSLDGKMLERDTDFYVTYTDNKNLGTAKAEIVGIEPFYGTVSASFNIVLPTVDSIYNLSAEATATSATVSWGKLNCTGYEVEKQLRNDRPFVFCTKLPSDETSYTENSLSPFSHITYRVRPYKNAGDKTVYGEYSTVTVNTAPNAVTGFAVSSKDTDRITLSWKNDVRLKGYEIYRFNGKKYELITSLNSSVHTFTDTELLPGTTYTYRIFAYYKAGTNTVKSAYTQVSTVTMPGSSAKISVKDRFDTYVTVSWSKVNNTDGYELLRRVGKTGKYTHIAYLSNKTTSFTDKNLSPGTLYCYAVRAYKTSNGSKVTGHSTNRAVVTRPKAVSFASVKSQKVNSITITWSKARGVSGYAVYRKNSGANGTYSLVKNLSAGINTFTDKKVKAKTDCCYYIRTYKIVNGKKYYSDISKVLKTNTLFNAKSVKLSRTKKSLGVGEKYKLGIISKPAVQLKYLGAKFTSSNSKVASVSYNGTVTAKKTGTAKITIKTANGKKATCIVTVKKAPTVLSLNKKSAIIYMSDKLTLAPVFRSNEASGTIKYSVSNSKIASVSSNGVVTPKMRGTVTVTAKTYNGKTAKCKIIIKIVNYKKAYTPNQVYKDINSLQKAFPDIIEVSTIGKSCKNRDIRLLKVGKGRKKALIVSGIHSREHITISFTMRTVEEYCSAYKSNQKYGGYDMRKLLGEYTLYIVPMCNPDGTQIANTAETPTKVFSGFSHDEFKCNARNVNLNRNFPFYWSSISDGKVIGTQNYRGISAGSEPETKVLMKLCEKNNFKWMFSMHTLGGGIYWRDSGNGVISGDYKLADELHNKCGYELFPTTTEKVDYGGGFENWFRYKYRKPGFCIEMIPFRCYYLSSSYRGYNKYFDKAIDWSKTRFTFAEAMSVKG